MVKLFHKKAYKFLAFGFILILSLLNDFSAQCQSTHERNNNEIFDVLLMPDEDGKKLFSITQDQRITQLLNHHVALNKARKGISGYRIQIYSGSGSSARNEALKIQAAFMKSFPDIESYLVYIEPYFRVRVGNFRNRAEGFNTFKKVSAIYPQCYFVIEKEMSFPALPQQVSEQN
jgi:hypothetical protein